ncbi:MAG: Bax inhibitor-1/YccA family protein, partial [Fibrobacter sp.]|nr:Bax inhibitor-1/YccA family protein [Fibrobacter sp.]
RAAPVLAPVYAILEGLALGGLSAFMESVYPGIAIEALSLTFAIFLSLLLIYKFKIIRATENFKLIVASATAGVALYYVVSLVAGLFHVNLPLIHSSSAFGIGFSLFVVILAAANLVVDFDFIERGAENRVPKFMEWYGAFGLLVTLVWLYVEILRLLAKLRSRD